MGKKHKDVLVDMNEDVKAELAALVHVYDILDNLNFEGKVRVLTWVTNYFDIDLS